MAFSTDPMVILGLKKNSAPASKKQSPERTKRTDPFAGYRFRIEVDGVISGGFTDVSGIELSTDVETVKEGGVNFYEHKLPKGSKFSDITLKRGLSDKEAIWDWYYNVVNGKVERKNLSILLLDESLKETIKRWDYYEAYPIKWTGPALNAGNNGITTEAVVITHHGMIKT